MFYFHCRDKTITDLLWPHSRKIMLTFRKEKRNAMARKAKCHGKKSEMPWQEKRNVMARKAKCHGKKSEMSCQKSEMPWQEK